MDAKAVIYVHYRRGSPLADALLDHSRRVRDKALAVAGSLAHLNPDQHFIAQGALLHDIGIIATRAPSILCHGQQPYIRHGIIGRRMLEAHGLHRHALVCERHIGTGISRADIRRQQLPLPLRDMCPVSLEETIICYADKFYSKGNGREARTVAQIVSELSRYGADKAATFMAWHARFSVDLGGRK